MLSLLLSQVFHRIIIMRQYQFRYPLIVTRPHPFREKSSRLVLSAGLSSVGIVLGGLLAAIPQEWALGLSKDSTSGEGGGFIRDAHDPQLTCARWTGRTRVCWPGREGRVWEGVGRASHRLGPSQGVERARASKRQRRGVMERMRWRCLCAGWSFGWRGL